MTREVRLLLASASARVTEHSRTEALQLLAGGIDWTRFARTSLEHGLAGLAGQALDRIAAEKLPDEIRDAFRANVDQTRGRNRALFDELAEIVDALSESGVTAIPFDAPFLTLQAYGDLGLRTVPELSVLVREPDIARAAMVLRAFGYESRLKLSEAQRAFMRGLRGRESLFKQTRGIGLEAFTRLAVVAAPIDHEGLRQRAQEGRLNGRTMRLLTSEDALLALSVRGGDELWRRMGRACDAAHFMTAHPGLDWVAILERARSQGCLRMVLLAAALACRYFGAAMPDKMAEALRGDRAIERMADRIASDWLAEKAGGPPSEDAASFDGLWLQDSLARRARYAVQALLWPKPYHVARVALPKRLTGFAAYVPIKIVADVGLRPLARAGRHARGWAKSARDRLASHDLAIVPLSEARQRRKRHREMRAKAATLLAADPGNADAWYNLGRALLGLGRDKEAIAAFDKALEISPDNPGLWAARSAAIRTGRQKTAAIDIGEDTSFDTNDANAWARRAGYLLASQRFAEASEASDRALAINPNHLASIRTGIRSRIAACDWHQREADELRIAEGVRANLPIITSFNHRTIRDSEPESLLVARLAARGLPRVEALWRGETYRHDRIRIAYLSAEFHEHPMMFVLAGVFEHHDKQRFETIGISLAAAVEGAMRCRVERAFDRFIDAASMSDAEIAAMLRRLEVDIAVDLNGFAGSPRPGILAHRPAPVQVNYLAYSGTMGVSFLDYIIADRILIPEESRIHYTEKVVYLPHSYMPTDRTRLIADRSPSRTEAELPETGFVFACHNALHKIAPHVFDVWMRLLLAVEGSVLWLKSPEPAATSNLRREAKARGVAPERLIFAPRLPQMEDHLARLRLADLFLDTLPYNAHATACDALWAGLPVLTCAGNTFAGRVGASLLAALELPELITTTLAEYEEVALDLARHPARLAATKAKLAANRLTTPLFNTACYTRDLENAYATMWRRAERGEPAESFAVSPLTEEPFRRGLPSEMA